MGTEKCFSLNEHEAAATRWKSEGLGVLYDRFCGRGSARGIAVHQIRDCRKQVIFLGGLVEGLGSVEAEEFRTKYEEAIKENAKYLTQSSSKSGEDKESPAKEVAESVEELSKDLAEKAAVEEKDAKPE